MTKQPHIDSTHPCTHAPVRSMHPWGRCGLVADVTVTCMLAPQEERPCGRKAALTPSKVLRVPDKQFELGKRHVSYPCRGRVTGQASVRTPLRTLLHNERVRVAPEDGLADISIIASCSWRQGGVEQML